MRWRSINSATLAVFACAAGDGGTITLRVAFAVACCAFNRAWTEVGAGLDTGFLTTGALYLHVALAALCWAARISWMLIPILLSSFLY
jgi:hypothetical protein